MIRIDKGLHDCKLKILTLQLILFPSNMHYGFW
jgi:hypothetical protein